MKLDSSTTQSNGMAILSRETYSDCFTYLFPRGAAVDSNWKPVYGFYWAIYSPWQTKAAVSRLCDDVFNYFRFPFPTTANGSSK